MAGFARGAGGGASGEAKPLLQFNGDGWENVVELKELRAFLLDWFGGKPAEAIAPLALERVIAFSASPEGWCAPPPPHVRHLRMTVALGPTDTGGGRGRDTLGGIRVRPHCG